MAAAGAGAFDGFGPDGTRDAGEPPAATAVRVRGVDSVPTDQNAAMTELVAKLAGAVIVSSVEEVAEGCSHAVRTSAQRSFDDEPGGAWGSSLKVEYRNDIGATITQSDRDHDRHRVCVRVH